MHFFFFFFFGTCLTRGERWACGRYHCSHGCRGVAAAAVAVRDVSCPTTKGGRWGGQNVSENARRHRHWVREWSKSSAETISPANNEPSPPPPPPPPYPHPSTPCTGAPDATFTVDVNHLISSQSQLAFHFMSNLLCKNVTPLLPRSPVPQ